MEWWIVFELLQVRPEASVEAVSLRRSERGADGRDVDSKGCH